jgi:transposase
MRRDDRTKAYVEKRTKEGKSRREIERVLVRYIAREVYRAIMHPMSASRASSEGAARSARAARVRMC